jgi:hypothetical protein
MNQKNVIKIEIQVDNQMEYEVKEYMKRYHVKTFEEAVFRLFEDGRQAFRDIEDEE